MNDKLRPDTFAIGLYVFGLVMLCVLPPLLLVPGLLAMVLALCYWLIMVVVKVVG